MIEFLLWWIALELTAGLAVGGYILYNMQLDIAIIALHDCADQPISDGPVHIHTVAAEIIDAPAPQVVDDKDTIGTFTGQAWS